MKQGGGGDLCIHSYLHLSSAASVCHCVSVCVSVSVCVFCAHILLLYLLLWLRLTRDIYYCC